MKSKKAISPLIGTVLIIGIVLIFVVVVMNFGILFKPTFTAEKKECHNKTGNYVGYASYKIQDYSNKSNWVYQNRNQICIPTKDRFVCYERIEICEQKPVDEIELYYEECKFSEPNKVCYQIKVSGLNEEILDKYCECRECEDMCITCIKWKCGEVEVKENE